MKKILTVFSLLIVALLLTACNKNVEATASFTDIDFGTTSVSFKLSVLDPQNEITGGVFIDCNNVTDNSAHSSDKEYDLNKNDSVTISNLVNGKSYRLIVKAAIGRKNTEIGGYSFSFGTANKYEISTPQDLIDIKNHELNADYVLLNDLDLTGIEYVYPFSSSAYKGTFDGGSHTIKNVALAKSTSSGSSVSFGQLSLFGNVSTGVIKNLNVENITIGTPEARLIATATTTSRLSFLVSTLGTAGKIENVNIDNAKAYYQTQTTSSSAILYVGGVVAECQGKVSNVVITNSLLDINVCSSANTWIGGLIGTATFDSQITSVRGDVSINYSLFKDYTPSSNNISKDKVINIRVGGIAGEITSQIDSFKRKTGFTASYNKGDINISEINFFTHPDTNTDSSLTNDATYTLFVGGIAGILNSPIENLYYVGNITVKYALSQIPNPDLPTPVDPLDPIDPDEPTDPEEPVEPEDPVDPEEPELPLTVNRDRRVKIYFNIGLIAGSINPQVSIKKIGVKGAVDVTEIEIDTISNNEILNVEKVYSLFGVNLAFPNPNHVVGILGEDGVTICEFEEGTTYYLPSTTVTTIEEFFTNSLIIDSLL